MKSKLIKVIVILIGLALAFAAGIYGASLLDTDSHENTKEKQKETAKEENELPEIDIDDKEEHVEEGIGEASSEDIDGNMIENTDSSETEGGMIILDSGDDSDSHSADEYSGSEHSDEYDEDELPEDEIIP